MTFDPYGPDLSSILPMVAIGLPVLLLIIWAAVTYNRLVSLRNMISDAWSNVDTELRRRYDLIPNLVETVKAYAAHEQAVFEAVAEARARAMDQTADAQEQAQRENELVRSLNGLFAVSEGYPQLQASQNFLALQRELVNTEDRIQAARRFYNGNVRDYNNLVEFFPSSMIAGMGSFERRQYFEVEDAVRRAVISIGDELRQAGQK